MFDLKKRRRQLHLTLEQVGGYVGVGKSTVRKWETGVIESMKSDKILLLAEILQVSPLAILGLEDTISSNYFNFTYDNLEAFLPKNFYDKKENLVLFKNTQTIFNIPQNSIIVVEKKEELCKNCIIAVRTHQDEPILIRKYNKMNDTLIIISDEEKDEIFDLFMGDYLEIIGEIIYHIIPENYYQIQKESSINQL